MPPHLPSSCTTGMIMLACALAGCGPIELARDEVVLPERASQPAMTIDVPQIMRGTIAQETIMLGYEPVIARGYGLVVGLNGTGSLTIPPSLRAHMTADMSRRGVGQRSSGMDHISPSMLLNSPDTAVVIVEGVIPPGAVGRIGKETIALSGTRFDLRVFADPRTGTTSLEGGRLYTCDLRPVLPGQMLPPTGSQQARILAEGRGEIFINPFAEPDVLDRADVDQNIGRIMNGGEVIVDMPIRLRLATPSHTRTSILQEAINTAFPRETGQPDLTAHGESDELIRVTIPTTWRMNPQEFVTLLRHTSIRQTQSELIAENIKRLVVQNPRYSQDASWRWRAIGKRTLPTLRSLYAHPNERPRLSALEAGSWLKDPLAIPHLLEMAESATRESKLVALRLLGEQRFDPRIDHLLRSMVNVEDIDIRLAAYESLEKRWDPSITRIRIARNFHLHVVPADKPMLYITQVGVPKIVLFGEEAQVTTPLLAEMWSGRLMFKSGLPDTIDVYYRPSQDGERIIQATGTTLEELIPFLGHRTTESEPDPGIGLSYSEVVGVLYQMYRGGFLPLDFKVEQDRVLAAINRQQAEATATLRPEFTSVPDPPTGSPGFLPLDDPGELHLPPSSLDGREGRNR